LSPCCRLLLECGAAVEMVLQQTFVAYLEAGGTQGTSQRISSERHCFLWFGAALCGVVIIVSV